MGLFSRKCGIYNHNFKARYSTIPPNIHGPKFSGFGFEEFIDLLSKKIYVHDICTKCGHIIKDES